MPRDRLADEGKHRDGSEFKAVNNRDKNFTRAKMERRLAQIDESVARYLSQLDTADLQEPSEALAAKTAHLRPWFSSDRPRPALFSDGGSWSGAVLDE